MRKQGLSIFHCDHSILWSQLGLQKHFHVIKWETDVLQNGAAVMGKIQTQDPQG